MGNGDGRVNRPGGNGGALFRGCAQRRAVAAGRRGRQPARDGDVLAGRRDRGR